MTSETTLLSNRYRLEERLGKGGMATVFRAHDLMLERNVAIKILRRDFSGAPEFRERFRQEARAAANLSHPNLVTVHDFGVDNDQLFIVMEYVPGIDLKTLLKQRGRLSVTEAIELINQACAGIGYAHRAGLVHCDVKPQNMLVTPEARLKVLDFGIARALASISEDEQTDVVWGSPQYFSPEQASGSAPSPASDVYSLGVVLYELLTGQLPFRATTSEELARLHREALPPSPRTYNPAIEIPLEQILLKVLSKEPSARYRTADQLGRVLISYRRETRQLPPNLTPLDSGQLSEIPPAAPLHHPVPAPVVRPVEHSANRIHPPLTQPQPERQSHLIISRPRPSPNDFDWFTWVLALLALVALGGLLPFLLWVLYIIKPPL